MLFSQNFFKTNCEKTPMDASILQEKNNMDLPAHTCDRSRDKNTS